VVAGWFAMNALRSFHWLAASFWTESSIRIARNRLSSFFQSVICLRSFPVKNWISSLAIDGAPSFFPTAVTVNVAVPEAAILVCAWANPTAKNKIAPSNTANFLAVQWCFILVLLIPFASCFFAIRCSLQLFAYIAFASEMSAIWGFDAAHRASPVTNSASLFYLLFMASR